MENGIIAVDRNNHPALLAGLEIMHTKFDADPIPMVYVMELENILIIL